MLKNDRYTYRVTWSDEDEEYVGLCAEFPSLSWLAKNPEKALQGIRKVVSDIVADMKKSGILVWLRATPETIKKRIVQDEKTEDQRPSLTAQGLLEEIEETLSNRNPLYENAMDFFVDTDSLSIDDICGIVVKKIKDLS